jgi:hypothetical protein
MLAKRSMLNVDPSVLERSARTFSNRPSLDGIGGGPMWR